jgi:DNA polymerase-3 subunit alpha
VGFSDPTGQYECVCFSDTLNACRDLLESGEPLMLTVEASVEGDDVKLRLQGIELLDKKAEKLTHGLRIFVDDALPLDLLKSRLVNGGDAPVVLVMKLPDDLEVEIDLGSKFTVNPRVKAAIKAVPGVAYVEDT